MTTKHFPVLIEKSLTDGYDARFVMSAATPDRVADTIAPKAYEANVGKKIIALWQHDPDKPMGYWENVKMQGDKLVNEFRDPLNDVQLSVLSLLGMNEADYWKRIK